MKTRMVSLLLLAAFCIVVVVPATADILYSNGPFNGDIDAWTINNGFSVSNSFLLPNNSLIEDLQFVYWIFPDGQTLGTVDMQIGSTSFGGNVQTLTGVSNTYLGANSFGYSLYQADYTFPGIAWSGAGWLTLSNACSSVGCSGDPIYWDQNNGPSLAFENSVGAIGSESFTLSGSGSGPPIPEPTSLLLFVSGVVGVAGVLRRRLF